MSGHTVGPWRTQGWVPTWVYIPVHGAKHNNICSVYADPGHGCDGAEALANASLIAAAPELLDACKGLLGLLTLTGVDKQAHVAGNHRIEAARAAIIKATGKDEFGREVI